MLACIKMSRNPHAYRSARFHSAQYFSLHSVIPDLSPVAQSVCPAAPFSYLARQLRAMLAPAMMMMTLVAMSDCLPTSCRDWSRSCLDRYNCLVGWRIVLILFEWFRRTFLWLGEKWALATLRWQQNILRRHKLLSLFSVFNSIYYLFDRRPSSFRNSRSK